MRKRLKNFQRMKYGEHCMSAEWLQSFLNSIWRFTFIFFRGMWTLHTINESFETGSLLEILSFNLRKSDIHNF